MPGKSHRRKGKPVTQGKKKRSRPSRPPLPAPPAAVTGAAEPVVARQQPVPEAAAPAPRAKPVPIPHPYIATELRNISILAGVMLVALVVLAWLFA